MGRQRTSGVSQKTCQVHISFRAFGTKATNIMQKTCWNRGISLHVLLTFWFCITGLSLLGQAEEMSSVSVDTINISASRLDRLSPGHRRVQIDSTQVQAMAGQNLADLLALHSGVFVKSYGQGSLATTSLRGGGASHTAVVWNGFSLQSPMNGQLDLALIPVFFLDQVAVQYGGSAALYGSGAIGGTLHLNNRLTTGKGVEVNLHSHVGSFGEQMGGLDVQMGGKNWRSRTRIFSHQAENDFFLPQKDDYQQHAAYSQSGFLQEGSIRISDRQHLDLWFWRQENHRELPPPLTGLVSFAEQKDQSTRIAATWRYVGDAIHLQARSAYFESDLLFVDSMANIDADNRDQTMIQEVEAEWFPHVQHRIHLGLTHRFQQAWADGYEDIAPQQQGLAMFGAWHWTSENLRWESALSLRQEWMRDQEIPLVPALSMRLRLNEWAQVRGQVGRTFRLPTFNDLYWSPGGNPNLVPERGWHQELGLHGQWRRENLGLASELTVFSQQINEWILWRPGPNFWYPENLRNVWSRGLELESHLQGKHGQWHSNADVSYSYTKATIRKTTQPRDLSLDKQLIYTPEHQASANLQLQRQSFLISYTHQLVGRRYTSTDNEFFLPAYDFATARVGYTYTFKQVNAQLTLAVNNIWNTSFQVIDNRAMPLRSYLLSLHLHVSSPKTKP